MIGNLRKLLHNQYKWLFRYHQTILLVDLLFIGIFMRPKLFLCSVMPRNGPQSAFGFLLKVWLCRVFKHHVVSRKIHGFLTFILEKIHSNLLTWRESIWISCDMVVNDDMILFVFEVRVDSLRGRYALADVGLQRSVYFHISKTSFGCLFSRKLPCIRSMKTISRLEEEKRKANK